MTTDPRLTVYKTIYAKLKGTFSTQMFHKVLNLEIATHLHKNPDLNFVGFGKEVKNPDLSTTYSLIFIPKPAETKP